ncbi:MAG: 3'-5' exonuclease [Thiobacillaceae bacterium]|nr:3'-5' exonuclease [Thiobacillaceae bacterium]
MIWPFSKRQRPHLDADIRARLDALPRNDNDLKCPLHEERWCVVDVETGGLDTRHDALLAIGVVIIDHAQIRMGESFEVHLQQAEATDAGNILIHGISGSVQREGATAESALLDYLQHVGNSPRVAFHAAFDQAVLQRDARTRLGWKQDAVWLDAAVIAPLLFPQAESDCRSLDDWLGYFGIANYARHGALADAFATAELWLVLLQAARKQGLKNARALKKLAQARRWLSAH